MLSQAGRHHVPRRSWALLCNALICGLQDLYNTSVLSVTRSPD